jgi:hypothetical protein
VWSSSQNLEQRSPVFSLMILEDIREEQDQKAAQLGPLEWVDDFNYNS